MSFEKLSEDLAALVEGHKQHTQNLVQLYEKSLQAQVQIYLQEVKAAEADTKKKIEDLQKLLKNTGSVS